MFRAGSCVWNNSNDKNGVNGYLKTEGQQNHVPFDHSILLKKQLQDFKQNTIDLADSQIDSFRNAQPIPDDDSMNQRADNLNANMF